jgi:hypothetical protein
MTRSLFLFVMLAGCDVDPASAPPTRAPAYLPLTADDFGADGFSVDDLSRVDVRGTATSIAMIARDVKQLSPEDRALAAESLRILSVNDPYTRSALQLPFALQIAVMDIPAASVGSFAHRDWEYLQAGLTTHVAVLESLGVDLPEPVEGDHLYGGEHGSMVDRDTLAVSDDPIRATSLLIDEITAFAARVDEPTSELISLHSDRVEMATGVGRPCPRSPFTVFPGQPWTLGMQLGGWHDALRRVEPFVLDPEVKGQIGAMNALFDGYGDANEDYIHEPPDR